MNWISLSDRRPTESDADPRGYVLVYLRGDRQWGYSTRVGASKWERVTSMKHTHWSILNHPGEEANLTLEQRVENIEAFLNL